jgi:hypothetical protein
VQKRKKADLDEFSDLSSATLEETVNKYQISDKIYTVEPAAKRQCISVNPFPGFAMLDNQFSNIVPGETEFSTVSDSAASEEHSSLESELIPIPAIQRTDR